MKKNRFIFTLLLFSTIYLSAQGDLISGDPSQDLEKLLPETEAVADLISGVKYHPRWTELNLVIQSNVEKNRVWFQNYLKNSDIEKPLPYHPNFGISKAEYAEYLALSKEIELGSPSQEKIKIKRSDNIISFQAEGKLKLYNHLKIDITKNQILFRDHILNFSDTIIVEDEDNGLKSKWKGYSWEFKKSNTADQNNPSLFNITAINFTIGQLEKNGKIYMQLKEREIHNVAKLLDNQIIAIF